MMPTEEKLLEIAEAASEVLTELGTDTGILAQHAALILIGACSRNPYAENDLRNVVGSLAALAAFQTAGRNEMPYHIQNAIAEVMKAIEPYVGG